MAVEFFYDSRWLGRIPMTRDLVLDALACSGEFPGNDASDEEVAAALDRCQARLLEEIRGDLAEIVEFAE